MREIVYCPFFLSDIVVSYCSCIFSENFELVKVNKKVIFNINKMNTFKYNFFKQTKKVYI